MEVNIFQVDAFSSRPFGGNPTVVVPNAKRISNEDKQKIANEMNVSYTTFVQQLGDERFKVNFYTPRQEVNFSGHGTIATFYAMAEMGYIKPLNKGIKTAVMETNNGRLTIEISYDYSRVDKVILQLEGPDYIGSIKDIGPILQALNINESQVGFEALALAPELIYTGLTYIILGVKDKESLDKLDIDTCSLLDICKSHKATGLLAFYLPNKDSDLVYSRSFAPTMGMEEEPATGIANGALVYYLKKHKLIEKDSITSMQGHSLNRPSKIYCYIEEEANKSKVKVGGNANIILEGILKY